MSIQQDLIATRALIADKANWTSFELSRNENHDAVWPTDERANCWCIGGALIKVVGMRDPAIVTSMDPVKIRYQNAERFLDREFGAGENPDSEYEDFAHFNDANPHEIVIAWLDTKIAEAAALELAAT
jgi:hypothetical protein